MAPLSMVSNPCILVKLYSITLLRRSGVTASGVRPNVTDEQLARIPLIDDLDAHLVEPADLWTSRLRASDRGVGPHVELPPMGQRMLDGGGYIEEPGTEGKPIAWWFYEDRRYSVKRLIAAAGYPADEKI